jgi:hypothetical protein
MVDAMQLNVSSPFGSSSWMDLDFLGGVPHHTFFDGDDLQELQQGPDIPRAPKSGLKENPAPRPVANMAWRVLAQKTLNLLKRMLPPQKTPCEE